MNKCKACNKEIYSSNDTGICLDCADTFPSTPPETEIIHTTTFDIAGKTIQKYLGIVRGITVRSPTITQGISGGFKDMLGGKIGAYVKMCETARTHAFEMMTASARELGANAVVGIRYDASDVMDRSTEVLCYGTAVIVE